MSIWCSREHIGNEIDWPEPSLAAELTAWADAEHVQAKR